MKEFRWMKTDTASIMFSSLSNRKWGRTFRVAVVLKDEEVKKDILEKAARDLVPSFPNMYSFIRKGFFWNYQQAALLPPEIREEHSRQILPITYRNDGRPDFRIVYYKRRIAIECAHYLCDGKGMDDYFNALLNRYFELCDNPDSIYTPVSVTAERMANSYEDYFQKDGEKADNENLDAYRLEGELRRDGIQLIFAMMSVEQLKEKAKECQFTITEYIVAALMLGTIINSDVPVEKPVVVAVPVNLRRFFPSVTVRNFTVQSKLVFYPEGRRDWTFEEICDALRGQLKNNTKKEELQKTLNRFGALAGNPVIKFVPNFIKQPVIRKSQKDTHAGFTTIFTNTGVSDFGPQAGKRIERVDGVNGDTSGYGLMCTCSAVSNKDIFNLCFSNCGTDISWVRDCVRVLSSLGLDIRIETNRVKGENE